MTTLLRTFSVGLVVASIVIFPATLSAVAIQQPAAEPQVQTPPNAPEPTRTFEGQLTKVDSTAKTLTLKGSDDKEMMFSYNDITQVVGADDGVQGLTGKTGSSLKVTYRDDRGSHWATKIEIVPKK